MHKKCLLLLFFFLTSISELTSKLFAFLAQVKQKNAIHLLNIPKIAPQLLIFSVLFFGNSFGPSGNAPLIITHAAFVTNAHQNSLSQVDVAAPITAPIVASTPTSTEAPTNNSRPTPLFVSNFTVSATAYCSGTSNSGCPIDENGHPLCTGKYADGFTATGTPAVAGTGSPANPHIVAVDPNVIPLGSLLYIDKVGFAKAADVGGGIDGYEIDILFTRHKDALRFGRQNLKVYILNIANK